MRCFACVPVILLGVAMTFAGASYAAPDWTRTTGLDFWNIGSEEESLRSALERSDEIASREHRETLRQEMAEQLAARLLAGEPLAELTDELEAFTREVRQEWFQSVRLHTQAAELLSDREVVALYLISKVKLAVEADPTRLAEVSARLSGELQALQAGSAGGPEPQ
jgi:hypothetical protein